MTRSAGGTRAMRRLIDFGLRCLIFVLYLLLSRIVPKGERRWHGTPWSERRKQ